MTEPTQHPEYFASHEQWAAYFTRALSAWFGATAEPSDAIRIREFFAAADATNIGREQKYERAQELVSHLSKLVRQYDMRGR